MSSPYYLSLGTGTHQKPLIEAAKRLGLKVIGVDQNPESPGMALCDLKIQESIFNYRKIHYKVNSLLVDGEVVGGFAASYGKALVSWAYLAEKFRLGGPSRPLAERLLDKYEVRKMLSGLADVTPGFRQPGFTAGRAGLQKKHLEGLKAPFIVKPRSGSGKHQVREFADEKSLRAAFDKKNLAADSSSPSLIPSSLIIEEKVIGDEITVCGFAQNFQFIPVCTSDKTTSSRAPFIELEHRYPSRYHTMSRQISMIHQEIVQTLQLTDTPIVSEWKVREDQFYLVEISAQIPGEFLASFLIPGAMSYDYYENLVKLTLGRNVKRPPTASKNRPGIVKYYPEKLTPGEIATIQKNSDFFALLNENPKDPPEGNADRFAVAGYIG